MTDLFDPLEPSPYKVLNISQDASIQQIRTAHRKLVLQYHPDKVQDESEKAAKTERFQEIQHAYEILQDDKRRSRWDRRAAERDRQIEERRNPRKASAYTPSRPSHGPAFENRDGIIYEERVPRYAKTSEENMFDAAFSSGPSKSSKKWNDGYEESSSRKTSGRGPETKSRYKDMDSDLYAKTAEKKRKEDTRSQREEAQKRRDKAKRQDKQASFSRRTRVEDYEDSDEYDDRYYSNKTDSKSKRKPADPYRYKDEAPRRSSRRNNERSGDEELERKISLQQDYLNKSRVESDSRRPARTRADSYSSRTQLPSPPLTPHDRDFGRRSSGDDGRKSSARSRRPASPVRRNTYKNIDVVDPVPKKKSGGSKEYPERSTMRQKTMPSRSRTTYDIDTPDFPKPGLKRAETMPIHHMSSAKDPRRGQKDPRMFDVGSSDESPSSSDSDSEIEKIKHKMPTSTKRPGLVPTQTRTSYKVSVDKDHPPIVTAEPESYEDRSRENSPKSMPRRAATDRYGSATTTTRSPLMHSHTFSERPSARRSDSRSSPQMPSLRTAQSARDRPNLFGAIDNDDSSPRMTSSPQSFVDPRIRSGRDLNSHSRRGSDDVRTDYSSRSSRMDVRRQFSSREIPAR